MGPLGQTRNCRRHDATLPADYIPLPLEYHRYTEGIKGRRRPDIDNCLFKNISFTAGYEYDYLDRIDAVWETPPQGPEAGTLDPGGVQQNTTTQMLYAGLSKLWCYNIDTYVRYKLLYVDNPLFGIRQENSVVDTNQPQHQDIVEFGGGWHPCSTFSISLQQEYRGGPDSLRQQCGGSRQHREFQRGKPIIPP